MAVKIEAVEPGSPAALAGIAAGDEILSVNGHEIEDVLDYRFYQSEAHPEITVLRGGETLAVTVEKEENEELGLLFSTYLMDRQHACRNRCVFCFIDQLPKGMRDSLYFKDDDSRMSFLFGNYITLTNITEHEVERILAMHISPINVSVHTTNPELRVRMMNNRFAGEALDILWRLADGGIAVNTQLVLCPGWNDGEELERSLRDLTAHAGIQSIALVPVGLTGHREGLTDLRAFTKEEAEAVLNIADRFGNECLADRGERCVYPADEFFLLAGRPLPASDYYEDYAQLENGVGLWSLTRQQAQQATADRRCHFLFKRRLSSVTGEAAYPLIRDLVAGVSAKWPQIDCTVYPIRNDYFGGGITVTGLVTATDIIRQLKGKDLGSELLVPSVMLRREGDRFLDDLTPADLERELGVPVRVIETDGEALVEALLHAKRR